MSDKLKLRFKDENGQDYIKWETKRIEDIADIKSSSIKSNVANGNYYNLTMGSVSEDGLLILDKKTNSNINLLKKNQLIMPTRDIGKGLIIGRVALIDKDNKYVAGNCLYTLNIKHDDSRFIFYQINSEKYRLDFLKKVTGSAQLMITEKDVRTQKIYMPCLQEQQKIADFLSTVDDKIENQKEIVANWEEIKKGLIQKIFSQEIRFKDENGQDYPEWENEVLGKLCVIEQKSKYPASYGKNDGLYPFILSNTSNEMKYADTYILDSESIIVNDGGEAYFRYINGKFAYSDHCIVLTTYANTKYIYYYLDANKKIINQKGFVGGGLKNIDRNYLKSFIIKIPSPEEQQKIADFLSTIDNKIEYEKNMLNELIELKKGLLQKIFA